jgi:hypothetical protein
MLPLTYVIAKCFKASNASHLFEAIPGEHVQVRAGEAALVGKPGLTIRLLFS